MITVPLKSALFHKFCRVSRYASVNCYVSKLFNWGAKSFSLSGFPWSNFNCVFCGCGQEPKNYYFLLFHFILFMDTKCIWWRVYRVGCCNRFRVFHVDFRRGVEEDRDINDDIIFTDSPSTEKELTSHDDVNCIRQCSVIWFKIKDIFYKSSVIINFFQSYVLA